MLVQRVEVQGFVIPPSTTAAEIAQVQACFDYNLGVVRLSKGEGFVFARSRRGRKKLSKIALCTGLSKRVCYLSPGDIAK